MARLQVPPAELDIKNGSVYANTHIPKGTRYGPFIGRWSGESPQNEQYCWEVSGVLFEFRQTRS